MRGSDVRDVPDVLDAHGGRRVGTARVFAVLALSFACVLWFGQTSFNAWWLQTWHRRSPLERLDAWPPWRSGAALRARLQALHDGAAEEAAPVVAQAETPDAVPAPELAPEPLEPEPAPEADASPPLIRLRPRDKVLFVGDSMMQGIAPLLQRALLREYGIRSVNLSRHSTGLSNAAYFNWPLAVENALRQHANARLLVVFLGANDPWDFFEGQGRRRFGTPEWDAAYAARALRMARAAHNAGVAVIWIGLPRMRAAEYDRRIRHLDAVLAQNLAGAVLWLPTDALLDGGTSAYADSIQLDGRLARVRHSDGIHLALNGQKLLAARVREHIAFEPEPETPPAP